MRLLPFGLIPIVLLTVTDANAQVQVRAEVRPARATVGERLTLSVEVRGSRDAPAPALDPGVAFDAQYVGPTTQLSSINGRVSTSVIHRYTLVPKRAGHYELGPFQVTVDDRIFASNKVDIEIAEPVPGQAGRHASGATELRLALLPAKPRVYVGERVPLTVKLMVSGARDDSVHGLDGLGDGIALEEFAGPRRGAERVDGRNFRVLEYVTHFTALRPGPLTLGPATLQVSVVEDRAGTSRDIFDLDFQLGFGRRRNLSVTAGAVMLEVLPLPTAGRPADFSGAVGQFDFQMSATPTSLTAGDPVNVRMEVRGVGNLTGLVPPRVAGSDALRAYDPQPLREQSGPGTYIAEQVVIPREPSANALPPVRFTFFEPESGTYQTITRGPVALAVNAAARVEEPRLTGGAANSQQTAAAEKLGRDIVYIKDRPGRLQPVGTGLPRGGWLLFHGLAPLALFGGISVWTRRRERLASDPRLARFMSAGRVARQALTKLARDGAQDGFYDELVATMSAYLAAKLSLSPGRIERGVVSAALGEGAKTSEVGRSLERIFDLLERVRYARGRIADGEREQALALAGSIVTALERDRGLERRLGTLAVWLLVAVTAAGAASEAPQFDPVARFYEANSAYSAARYDEARTAYESIIDSGQASGAAYFNLGNAYFKLGRSGAAILNYERARRSLPRDPDVRANLAYAREPTGQSPAAPPLWRRILLPLAERATVSEQLGVALAGWWLLWALLVARPLLPRLRRGLGQGALASGLVVGFLAANLLGRGFAVEWQRAAVVTTGEAAVRYEPSASGSEYFRLPEGILLVIDEEREGWLRAQREDGLRGWIATADVGRL